MEIVGIGKHKLSKVWVYVPLVLRIDSGVCTPRPTASPGYKSKLKARKAAKKIARVLDLPYLPHYRPGSPAPPLTEILASLAT